MISNDQVPSTPVRTSLVMGAARYLAGKVLTIAIAVFIGVFITVLIANQPSRRGLGPPVSPFETSLEAQVDAAVRASIYNGTIHLDDQGNPDQNQVQALTEKLRRDAGLDLPYLPRYLLWTVKALTFNWGPLGSRMGGIQYHPAQPVTAGARDILLQYLPNTLLLMGTAYFLVFLIGLPLSLYLARNHGSWLDRLFAFLSPVSSVPSWVFGILLITVFAFELRWLPFGRMFDFNRPENPIEYMFVVSKHMILPVSAVVLSLLFQVIYAWRTFFIIYSEEDYVELARAKGLPSKDLEKQYILRPALPYILTSFATTLVSFWQLSMALEVIFQWPGLGWLYIKEALPNFWGESMEPGELIIVVGIVVVFAYLLGGLVFILDFTYAIIDPRIRLLPSNNAMQTLARAKPGEAGWIERFKVWWKKRIQIHEEPAQALAKKQKPFRESAAASLKDSILEARARSALFFQELRRYPSAIFGLAVILMLCAGSVYAVICLPYEQVGRGYNIQNQKGRSYVPRTAMPAWTNWFSSPPRLSTLIMDESGKGTTVSMRTLDNGWIEKTTTFAFNYSYNEAPSEVFLYLDSKYSGKIPFASLKWTYPDGRTLTLKNSTVGSPISYDFESGINTFRVLEQNPEWKKWFVDSGQYPTPAFNMLFAAPNSSRFILQRGNYQLTVTSLLFEKDSDLQPQLVLLGQVYGLAGTDFMRHDLVVPLFWGMPIALLVGLLGMLLTTLIAMLLPAIGVWFGGWVDNLVQRLTEINMVLPSLTIAVLMNVLFGLNIWIILSIVIAISALGSPVKILRSALLQAKEAPYIEAARSYGASDTRIITSYLVPRILPVLIPQLVAQVPSFIFWEATLGFFNIQSTYPSWGRVIYDGLSNGALYGSPFWVLEPISLLLLTSLAFAMLGSALERILNPRMIDSIPAMGARSKPETTRADNRRKRSLQLSLDKRVVISLIAVMAFIIVIVLFIAGRTLASAVINFTAPSQVPRTNAAISTSTFVPTAAIVSSPTNMPASVLGTLSVPTQLSQTPTITISPTLGSTLTSFPIGSLPATYILQPGEFPYCIARRFNVHPNELLALNGLGSHQVFYAGTVLQIPQTGNLFPGNRMLSFHPTMYTVSRQNETTYGVACLFGDIDPALIAQANNISMDSMLLVGQQLKIP